MRGWQKLAFAMMAWTAVIGAPGIAAAQTKPEGEMRFALYVTVPPAWLDPGEAAAAYVRHLEQHPLDMEAREKLAVLYAGHFKRLDLAASELEQMIAQPNQPPKLVVSGDA